MIWEIWRNICGECVHIVESKAYLRTCLLAASLHRGPARNYDHQLGAKVGENISASPAEAVPVSKQQHNRGYSPSHAEHGQGGAPPVMLHGAIGLLKQITEHCFLTQVFTHDGVLPLAEAWRPGARGTVRRSLRPASNCQLPESLTRAPVSEDQIPPVLAGSRATPLVRQPVPCRSVH